MFHGQFSSRTIEGNFCYNKMKSHKIVIRCGMIFYGEDEYNLSKLFRNNG